MYVILSGFTEVYQTSYQTIIKKYRRNLLTYGDHFGEIGCLY